MKTSIVTSLAMITIEGSDTMDKVYLTPHKTVDVTMKLFIRFALYTIVVFLPLLSCSRFNKVHYDVPQIMLIYSDCFDVVNPRYKVASFHTAEYDTIYVVKRSISNWTRSKYRKITKGDSVQISLNRNERIDTSDLGFHSALKLDYSIGNEKPHRLDFSTNGNIYDSPDIIITDDNVYLKISKDIPIYNER